MAYDPDEDDSNLTRDCVTGCEPATRQEELEALGYSGEADYAEHHRVMQASRDLADQQIASLIRATAYTIPTRYWDDYSDRSPADNPDQMPVETKRSGSRVTIVATPEQCKYLLGDAKFYADGNTDDTPRAVISGAKRVVEILTSTKA